MIGRLLLSLLLLFTSHAAHAIIEASVDRTRLVEGETLELTLESGAANRFSSPDLAPLEEHFETQGTRQLSLVTQLDGRTQPVTRWVITLAPKRTGYVVIPPITLDDSQSDPISLHVLSAAEAARDSSAQMAPVFIDTEVDTESPYVQAQVLLTLRIYHSVSLYDDSSLTGLEIADTRVEGLGTPQHYERLINGVRHGVIEVRYAIFPQYSGSLEIPSQLFSATTMPARDPSAPFASRTGRLVQVRSPSIVLDVKPVPDEYPANTPWLPAAELTLSEDWQPEPGLDLLVGESLTRSIRIEASGLHASQLPDLTALNGKSMEGLRQYADQPKLETSIQQSGVLGLRQDSAALLVQSAGQFRLPALQLYWWNTQTDSLQKIELEAVELKALDSDSVIGSLPEQETPQVIDAVQAARVWPWQLATLILALLLSLSLTLLYRSARQLRSLNEPDQDETIFDTEIQGNPLADLQAACRSNHASDARKALEAWARQQDQEGLIALTHRHPELADALDDLNANLFGQSKHPWRGKPLWRAVRLVVQSQQRQVVAEDTLEPLYPQV